MEGIDAAEVWDWEDNAFKLDVDSPYAMSQSFWDVFSQSETDVTTLFASTPASEIAGIKLSSFTSEKRSIGQPDSKDHNITEDNPSVKRRRMLDFQVADADVSPCTLHLDSVSQTFMAESDDYILNSESFEIQELTSGGSMWFSRNDDSLSSVDDANEFPAESWTVKCSTDGVEQSSEDQMNMRGSMSIMPEKPVAKTGQGIQTIISACRGTMTGRTGKLIAKLATPVAYPFALIKPIGVQGDVTLNDINQRIMMPSSKSAPHVEIDRTPPSPPVSNHAPSGKSVVALTKIHTEGRGTITIMRTKN